MPMTADQSQARTATLVDLGAIFVSLEMSKSTWLVTALSPVSEKMSRHTVTGGDIAGLFACFSALRQKAKRRKDRLYPLAVIQEAGLDGFWLGRVLSKEASIESHIVEAAVVWQLIVRLCLQQFQRDSTALYLRLSS
jgi:transposase